MSRIVNTRVRTRIVIQRDNDKPDVLDCPICKLSLRDWEDYISVELNAACSDCMNKPSIVEQSDN